MTAPARYFDTVPQGAVLLAALQSRTPRAVNLVGDLSELRKVLTAIALRYPTVYTITSDEFRSRTTAELTDDYHRGPMVIVNYPRDAKGLDKVTLQVTSYTATQIARSLRAKTARIADAEAYVDSALLGRGQGDLARANLHLHFPDLAQQARRTITHLRKTRPYMFTDKQISELSPEEYKQHRAQLLSGSYRESVRQQVEMGQREEREKFNAANPNAEAIAGLTEARDRHAKAGRNVDIYDKDIARLQAEQDTEKKRKAFESSPEYEVALETSMRLRSVVAKYDEASLPSVDAELILYREHQDTDRLNTALVRVSRDAWMAEMKANREAEHAALKAEHELAQSNLARTEESASTKDLRAQYASN